MPWRLGLEATFKAQSFEAGLVNKLVPASGGTADGMCAASQTLGITTAAVESY